MITIYDAKILSYLFFILAICLLPVYLFRRNLRELSVVACVIAYFFILHKNLIWGKWGVYHDTRFTYEYILTLLKQWLDRGIDIGWNPYMNAGEPFYLFSDYFLRAAWVPFCWINRYINIDSQTLFNLFWTFQFVNFCVGSLLLFLVLFDDFRAALFSFMALITSGMFITNLGQPTGLTIMYYFPYLLFCIILSFKRKNVYGIALAIIFLGIAFNYYLPHYILLGIGIFIFFMGILNPELSPRGLSLLKSQYKILVLALVFFILAASPALFMYNETKDYISPTRGGLLPRGAISSDQTGEQPNVNAPLWGYKILLEKTIDYRRNIHHAFYFGIIPLLFIPAAFLTWRNKYIWAILASTIVMLFLSNGNDFWGYNLLVRYIPGFNMIRHSFGLAHFVSFFMICLSGYGFKKLMCKELNARAILKSAPLLFFSLLVMFSISRKSNVVLFGSLGVFIPFFISTKTQILPAKAKVYLIKNLPLFFIVLLLIDTNLLHIFNYKVRLLKKDHNAFADFIYPQKRTFYPLTEYPIPIDLSPLIFKKASLTHSEDNFILFRHSRLNDMLKLFAPQKGYEPALGVSGDIVYFTQNAKILPQNTSKDQFIKAVYEDSSKNPLRHNQRVFFSERDGDFGIGNNKAEPKSGIIEYIGTDNPNEAGMSVKAPADGFLIRLENFHPNWKALVNNKRTRIYRANYAFQAIRIPRGRHNVVFKFSTIYPLLFRVHIFCAFLAWLAFNIYIFVLPYFGKNALFKGNEALWKKIGK